MLVFKLSTVYRDQNVLALYGQQRKPKFPKRACNKIKGFKYLSFYFLTGS